MNFSGMVLIRKRSGDDRSDGRDVATGEGFGGVGERDRVARFVGFDAIPLCIEEFTNDVLDLARIFAVDGDSGDDVATLGDVTKEWDGVTAFVLGVTFYAEDEAIEEGQFVLVHFVDIQVKIGVVVDHVIENGFWINFGVVHIVKGEGA
jgi:hypothetical protein